mmetsp:Transcript_27508/g.73380  ORF Transcript_27508/g.73380 Transcript_27508/m.73380 type:complete len:260 (+) Transcript_27508:316-1095(+)
MHALRAGVGQRELQQEGRLGRTSVQGLPGGTRPPRLRGRDGAVEQADGAEVARAGEHGRGGAPGAVQRAAAAGRFHTPLARRGVTPSGGSAAVGARGLLGRAHRREGGARDEAGQQVAPLQALVRGNALAGPRLRQSCRGQVQGSGRRGGPTRLRLHRPDRPETHCPRRTQDDRREGLAGADPREQKRALLCHGAPGGGVTPACPARALARRARAPRGPGGERAARRLGQQVHAAGRRDALRFGPAALCEEPGGVEAGR